MKRQFFFGTMLSATLAIGVGAQQTPGGQTAGDQGATRTGQAITVTGCLRPAGQMAGQAGAPTATPETGAQAGQQQARGFILTNVSPGGAAGAGTTGAGTGTAGAGAPRTGTGTAGTGAGTATGTGAAAGTRASAYRLIGGDDQNLQQHVGHRVEVTGTMTPGAGTGTGAGAGTGTSAGTGTTPGTGTGAGTGTGTGSTTAQGGAQGAATPTLRVTSVKPVAGTCP